MAAPDFLDCGDAIVMARHHPELLARGSRLQRLGEDLLTLCGGRAVHPVGLCVGGLHRAPGEAEVALLCRRLETGLPDAEALLDWCAGLEFPADQQVFTSVALSDSHDLALAEGAIISGSGLHMHIMDLPDYLETRPLPYSTLPHSLLEGQPYLVGPLARINLNLHQLPPPVREWLQACPIAFPSHNMFHSILARAAEVCSALHEALRLLQDYQMPERSRVAVQPRGGRTVGCVEGPRGLVWHSYQVDAQGIIRKARILTPTAQNLARMEQDLTYSLQHLGAQQPEPDVRLKAERVVRNYDPGFCD
jgi:coenzyme F420-reducing hydrogenase alpha subunit